jgi:hypothetical protein
LAIFAAIRPASSRVSGLAADSRVVEMYVAELLPVVVLEIRFAFFNGPGRREATWSQNTIFD